MKETKHTEDIYIYVMPSLVFATVPSMLNLKVY